MTEIENKKQKQTQDNNALARDRTVLANERTFPAWLRTGLSFFATGLGVVKFLKEEMPHMIVLFITITLLLLSIASFLQAVWRFHDLHLRISHLDVDSIALWKVKLIGFVLVICALFAILGIVFNSI